MPDVVSRLRGSKVPLQITALFWVIKVLTTAMGEATSDYLVHAYSPYLAVLLGFAVFAIALVIQLRAKSYVPWIYWLAVMMVQVASRGFRPTVERRLNCFSLFWHALDIIWVWLFTIVYLLGVSA